MAAYSFQSVSVSIVGPGGAVTVGGAVAGGGVAGEGVTLEMISEADAMTVGADGSVMHSLTLQSASTVTLRLQKTSPFNFILQEMYNLQQSLVALWGQNTIVITDVMRGDITTCLQCAFRRQVGLTYATEGGNIEWTFNCGQTFSHLGVGIAGAA